MSFDEEYLKKLRAYIDDIVYDKRNNTLADWIADYGAIVSDDYTITFGSHYALTKMLERRDKEVIRTVLANLFNDVE